MVHVLGDAVFSKYKDLQCFKHFKNVWLLDNKCGIQIEKFCFSYKILEYGLIGHTCSCEITMISATSSTLKCHLPTFYIQFFKYLEQLLTHHCFWRSKLTNTFTISLWISFANRLKQKIIIIILNHRTIINLKIFQNMCNMPISHSW